MYYSNLFTNIKYNNVFLKNIFKKYKIIDKYKNKLKYYEDYYIKDGETPEIIAQNIYNDINLYFVILLMNDIYNIYEDWVKSDIELEQYINNFNNYIIENLKPYILLMKKEYDFLKNNDQLNVEVLKNKYKILFKYKFFIDKNIDQADEMINKAIDYFYSIVENEDYFDEEINYLKKIFKEYIGNYFRKKNEEKRKIKILKKEIIPFLFKELEEEKFL